MASDITEEFQVDLTNPNQVAPIVSSVQTIAYDLLINDLGFHLAINPEEPYRRQTAQYNKDQSDDSPEPGEQSLSGWWVRSQSSFHLGAGTKFFDPAQQAGNAAENQTLRFRFETSEGVNVWEKGEVTLLNDVFASDHYTVGTEKGSLRSIPQGVLMHDGHDIDKIASDGSVVHFVDYITGTSDPVYSVCDDGTNAYWVTKASSKYEIWKKPLASSVITPTGNPATEDAVRVYNSGSYNVTNSCAEWVKERMVFSIDNVVYEFTGSGTPTSIYTFNSSGTVINSITASGSAVYVAYNNGIDSGILQLSLDTDTLLLTPVGITAETPRGEIIWAIKYYLGYVVIGTNYGVRVAQVLDNGSLVYGPLLFRSSYPCYQFAASDHFVWAACGVGTKAGLVRIDLSAQVDTLVFPYANDLSYDIERETTGVAFMDSSEVLAFTTPYTSSNGDIYIEDPTTLVASGYLTTGRIRYNTLENKLYKFIIDRATYNGASEIDISVIDKVGDENLVYTANSSNGNNQNDIGLTDHQEFIQLKFTLHSAGTSTPQFYGYQLKALPAARRQRLIQYPVFNMDTQTDRYNNQFGYTDRAYSAVVQLEQLEENGDVVTVTDNRTGETFKAMIEEISYSGETPPDRVNSNFGGKLLITVRKI